jgi:hypothetical protein
VRRRAEFYNQQLDALRTVRQEVRRELLAEGKKHQAWKRLCQIPSIGPIRSAVLLGILQTRTVSAPSGSYGRTADLKADISTLHKPDILILRRHRLSLDLT